MCLYAEVVYFACVCMQRNFIVFITPMRLTPFSSFLSPCKSYPCTPGNSDHTKVKCHQKCELRSLPHHSKDFSSKYTLTKYVTHHTIFIWFLVVTVSPSVSTSSHLTTNALQTWTECGTSIHDMIINWACFLYCLSSRESYITGIEMYELGVVRNLPFGVILLKNGVVGISVPLVRIQLKSCIIL